MSSEVFRFGEKDGVAIANAADSFVRSLKPPVSGLLPSLREVRADLGEKIQDEKEGIIASFLNKHFKEFPIGSADIGDEATSLLVGFNVWKVGVINAEVDIKDDRVAKEIEQVKNIHLEDLGNYARGRKKHFADEERTAFLGSMEKQRAHDNEELWGKIWDVASLAIMKSTRNH